MTQPYYTDEAVTIYHMDCREWDGKADVIVTDPPYGLEFMGKEWDKLGRINSGRTRKQNELTAICRGPESYMAGAPMQAWHTEWASHLLGKAGWLFAFGGTRTWHRH